MVSGSGGSSHPVGSWCCLAQKPRLLKQMRLVAHPIPSVPHWSQCSWPRVHLPTSLLGSWLCLVSTSQRPLPRLG